MFWCFNFLPQHLQMAINGLKSGMDIQVQFLLVRRPVQLTFVPPQELGEFQLQVRQVKSQLGKNVCWPPHARSFPGTSEFTLAEVDLLWGFGKREAWNRGRCSGFGKAGRRQVEGSHREMGIRRGGWTGLQNLSWIINPLLSSLALHWTAQICISNFAVVDPSTTMGVDTLWHGIRGITINPLILSCMDTTSSPVLDKVKATSTCRVRMVDSRIGLLPNVQKLMPHGKITC